MGVAALVLGILSIVFCWIPVLKWVGFLIAFIGIILGACGLRNPAKKGIAIAGLVLSIIGFILCIVLIFACNACGAAALSSAALY